MSSPMEQLAKRLAARDVDAQAIPPPTDEAVDVFLTAALTDMRHHWKSLVDESTGALRDTDQGSMVTRAAYAISEGLKRGKRNAERIAELEAENARLRNQNRPDPRIPPTEPMFTDLASASPRNPPPPSTNRPDIIADYGTAYRGVCHPVVMIAFLIALTVALVVIVSMN